MKNIFLIIFLSACFALDASSQTVWYVNYAASGAGNGANWDDAFTNLHTALNIAQAGDAVWVAEGEYFPNAGSNRAQAFILKSGVRLLGGFAGNENSPTQRDLAAHPVTLNGNIGNPADSTDNSYTILYLPYPDSSTLIDGFTFANGFAYSDTSFILDSPVLSGGAVYVKADNGIALPTFSHCTFRNNYAAAYGGAIYVSGQNTQGNTPVFRFCDFSNNRAWRYGGAICIASGGNSYDRGVEFYTCLFKKNSTIVANSGQGGCIYMGKRFGNEDLEFINCVFEENYSYHFGGVISLWLNADEYDTNVLFDSCLITSNYSVNGPAIFSLFTLNYDYRASFRIKNSIIKNNWTQSSGSSISGTNTLFYADASPEETIIDSLINTNNKFINNKARSLITLSGYSAYDLISNNIYDNNQGISESENVFLLYCNGLMKNNFVINNRGLFLCHSNSPQNSSRIGNNIFYENKTIYPHVLINSYTVNNSIINFYNNLILSNSQTNQQTFSANVLSSNIAIQNNIFLNNRDSSGNLTLPLRVGWDSIFLSHNLMDVDCADLPSPAQCGTGNIFTADALLADTASGDFHPLPCSPAINAGDNGIIQAIGVATDLGGHPRIGDGIVDIGPYESPSITLAHAPVTTGTCYGLPSGSVAFDLTNACPPYSFLWSDGVTNGTALDGLPAGDYAFSIVDGKGKILVTDVVILGSSPQLTLSGDSLGCPGFDDGQIHAELSGAETPLIFNWSNGAQGPDLFYLPPGMYSVTATDALGCVDSADLAITDASPLTAIVDIQPATGPASPDGSIHFQPTGGADPFNYWWDTGDTLPFVGGLLPGQYGLTVSDAAGCDHVYGYTVEWVNDLAEAFAFPWRLYPNPAIDYVLLEGPRTIDGSTLYYTLFDAAGRQVLQIPLADSKSEKGRTMIQLHNIPAGSYRWELSNGKSVIKAGRLIKNQG